MFKLPFGWLPAHWGTSGNTREILKAEYELYGYELDKRLLELREIDNKDYIRKTYDLKKKYNMLTDQEYNQCIVNLIEDPKQRALAILELEHQTGKIEGLAYEKQLATLKEQPWVTVLSMDFGGKKSLEGSFELDWNELFVENLKNEGYEGATPDSIVNQWFMEVCRNVALEEFDGTGDFTADSDANIEAMKRWNAKENSTPKPFGEDRRGYR